MSGKGRAEADAVSSVGRLAAQEVPLGSTLLPTPASLMTSCSPHLSVFPIVFLPPTTAVPLESLALIGCTQNRLKPSAKASLLPWDRACFPNSFQHSLAQQRHGKLPLWPPQTPQPADTWSL